MIIDKEGYHYDECSKQYILDEKGERISTQYCLCNAYTPSDCVCAYKNWGNYAYYEFSY